MTVGFKNLKIDHEGKKKLVATRRTLKHFKNFEGKNSDLLVHYKVFILHMFVARML